VSSIIPPQTGLALVENDVRQLENLAAIFRMSGYSALAFGCPVPALSALTRRAAPAPDF